MKSKLLILAGLIASMFTLAFTSCSGDGDNSESYTSYYDGTFYGTTLNITINGTTIKDATVITVLKNNTLNVTMSGVPDFKAGIVMTLSMDDTKGLFTGNVTSSSSIVYDVAASYSDIYSKNHILSLQLTKHIEK